MSLLPARYLDAVAVLEDAQPTEDGLRFQAVATGTLLGYKIPEVPEGGEPRWGVMLATNKHVVEGRTEAMHARFNMGDRSERFEIGMTTDDGESLFVQHEDFDIALTVVKAPVLQDAGAEFRFIPEEMLLDLEGMKSTGISAGDGESPLQPPRWAESPFIRIGNLTDPDSREVAVLIQCESCHADVYATRSYQRYCGDCGSGASRVRRHRENRT